MKREILKCGDCNDYTLKEICSKCSGKAISPKPAKFDVKDRYGEYRRRYKQEHKL